MDDASFMIGLMKRNTDALGFIPSTVVRARFVKQNWYLIQRNRFGKRLGYLIHGPARPPKPCFVHQACIDFEKRNRGFGTELVDELVARATRARCRLILLRCAIDLDAIDFWIANHFQPIQMIPGGQRRRRTIIRFAHLLHPSPRPIIHPRPGLRKIGEGGRQLMEELTADGRLPQSWNPRAGQG